MDDLHVYPTDVGEALTGTPQNDLSEQSFLPTDGWPARADNGSALPRSTVPVRRSTTWVSSEVRFFCNSSPALELPYVRGLGWADVGTQFVLADVYLRADTLTAG